MGAKEMDRRWPAGRVVTRCGSLALIAMASFFALFSASALGNAPQFQVGIQHETSEVSQTPGVITPEDQLFHYTVSLTNTGTTDLKVGETLKCTTGTWSNSPTGFAYQWTSNGSPISGATTNSYTVTAGDAGTALQCIVSGTNASGTGQASSAAQVVNPVPGTPVPTPPSTLATPTGTVASGNELTCAAGTWGNGPISTYTYRWFRNGALISGPTTTAATTSKYTLTPGDVAGPAGFQCAVTATNAGGSVAKFISGPKTTTTAPNPPLPIASGTGNAPIVSGGTVTVKVALPAGINAKPGFSGGGGAGWSCTGQHLVECTRNDAPALGTAYPSPIKLNVFPDGSQADEVTTTVTVSGGGASSTATGQDILDFAPNREYGANIFTAEDIDSSSNPFTQAGGHPYSASTFLSINSYVGYNANLQPVHDARTIAVELPPGFVGNPREFPACEGRLLSLGMCPIESQVGVAAVLINNGGEPATVGVFNMLPEPGHPAEFAFMAAGAGEVHVYPTIRSDDDYGVTVTSFLTTEVKLRTVKFTFWGTPADPSHNAQRCFQGAGGLCFGGATTTAPLKPLLTNPTNCDGLPVVTTLQLDSWQFPGQFIGRDTTTPPATGCATLTNEWTTTHKPSITFQPDNTRADTPAGYNVNLHVPQEGFLDSAGLATPGLDNSTFTLPKGVTLTPSAANGLAACSESEMGLTSESPIRFNKAPLACPEASKVGSIEVQTPIIADPFKGSVYLAKQDANPFHSRFGIYLAIDDKAKGLMLKLAGKVEADPVSGQLTAKFTENPQLPFDDLRIHFFGGPRAALVNPNTCGSYTTNAALTPWSAVDPANPTAAETVTPSDSFTIDSGPNGTPCASSDSARPFDPSLTAGTVSTTAGASTPFVLKLTRKDGEQELTGLELSTPRGFTASLKGVASCSEQAIKAAEGQSSGAAELAKPSCPAASQIGTVTTGAGAGDNPFYVGGKAYLAGPYKGAPISMVIVTPAVAGPFDLGNVVVRAALNVDPTTAQITVKSDPIPRILFGVPLQVRSIAVNIDRPGFTRNPTSCEPTAITGTLGSASGKSASISNRFQVGGCGALAFTPKLSLNLKGGTKRNDHPALTATLTQPEGQANIGSVSVALPHSEFLDQAHIRTVCTRVQFAAHACPAGSVYGYAEAISPLLDQPISGPVYLRSSDNKLPDLVAALRGPDSQPIEVNLVGRIDSIHGGIRNSFELVPDAPVSRFVLSMKGGKQGLLVNSRNICAKAVTATARVIGQNGKRADQFPKLTNDCKKKAAKKPRIKG